MREKVQTSLWLDRDVKRLIEDEHMNLSRFVNNQVLICLSVDNEAEILDKIKEHEMCIKTLKTRFELVKARQKDRDNVSFVAKQALDELREYFSARMESEKSRDENIAWILSPRTVGRCKILNKSPEQVLDELEAWFDGVKKSVDEKD